MTEQIDLRHIPYMPLVIDRLRRSKAWLQCKRRPDLAFYMMNLWMHSWHEVPAGSIEADDDVLADAAMCSPERWDEIKGAVLRGWEQGEDGRLYHHVVVELADEAVGKMRSSRARTKKARETLEAKRKSEQSHDGDDDGDGSVTESVTDAVTETVTGDEGKGREGKTSGITVPNGTSIPGADAPDGDLFAGAIDQRDPPKVISIDPVKALFDRGVEILGQADVPEKAARQMIGQLRKAKGDREAMAIITDAARATLPVDYIQGAINHGRPDRRSNRYGRDQHGMLTTGAAI
ncbi:DUF1376 domain-containing protein [Azospirillum sp. TSO5]|uniref:DUF1376 domain-containing protein n=1 Tax=Azospirillum sp. TSO5 TaxID=716760 RepID=UPI000D60AAAA|nr:DUF1376 domain-containing protein [Azospirillum sp. TSO5]PWC96934.1 hypothetical protein TSO5_05750 [Azospirillum sp. TSO5]